MVLRKVSSPDPSKSGIERVAEIWVDDDYDPFGPVKPSPIFKKLMREKMEQNESFREWMQKLGLADEYLEETTT